MALITTFYGVILANCIFIPIANKLEIAQEREMLFNELIVEGVIAIKEGENPRFIRERLMNFLEDNEIQQGEKKRNLIKQQEMEQMESIAPEKPKNIKNTKKEKNSKKLGLF